jgi:hypothetical protein
LADAAAEGKWRLIKEILPQVLIHTVILEDIMDEILPLGSWHWRDECGKLVMSGIKERVMRLRGKKYKQARDDKRAAEGRPPRWVGTATELAAYCVLNWTSQKVHKSLSLHPTTPVRS